MRYCLGIAWIRTANGALFRVTDTQKRVGDLIIHQGVLEKGGLKRGDAVELDVDHVRRRGNRQHHSATHLLHEALRETLGHHVAQKGSLVEPGRLRFDFSHNKAMSGEELAAVETMANAVVLQNNEVNTRLMSVDEAIAEGAFAAPPPPPAARRVCLRRLARARCHRLHRHHLRASSPVAVTSSEPSPTGG